MKEIKYSQNFFIANEILITFADCTVHYLSVSLFVIPITLSQGDWSDGYHLFSVVSWIVVMEIVYCEIVGNDFFLDIVSWIVVVLSSTKIIYSSSFGEMVRMGTGSVQIVLDLIWRKRKRSKRKIQWKILHFDTLTAINIFFNWEQLRSPHKSL